MEGRNARHSWGKGLVYQPRKRAGLASRSMRPDGASYRQCDWRRRIADGRRLVSTRAQKRYALIPIVSTPLYAPEAPPVTIGVCAAICLGVLSAKTSSRSTLTEVKFAALAP
jgi:hypothetical protein